MTPYLTLVRIKDATSIKRTKNSNIDTENLFVLIYRISFPGISSMPPNHVCLEKPTEWLKHFVVRISQKPSLLTYTLLESIMQT